MSPTASMNLLVRAERELMRVHALELARLLRRAVLRRCQPDHTERRLVSGRWAAAMRTELAGRRADGLPLPRALLAPTRDRTLAFAEAASELDPCSASEVCLAAALLRRGDERAARGRLTRALARHLPVALRRQAERALASCSEATNPR